MLPVLAVESDITRALAAGNRLVLAAPTGSGKTTQVPQILHRSGLLAADQTIIVLQPRRLATRMVARRVAQEMGSPLGRLVGYQTRHDSQISQQTRIRFMTEGLLLRLLQNDPDLSGIGAVVLDEFHERNLAADLSLGLLKQLQERTRPELRLLVMSATLDIAMLRSYLACAVVETGGKLFPVTERYLPHRLTAPPWELAAQALRDVLAEHDEGDVLIFMPGAYEIRRTIEACCRVAGDVTFFPLHGSLPPREQDAAVSPYPGRKVVVSTNVAETSITIEGIRHVIDSGLGRVHRYDARRGINVLRVEPISQASATQRCGRAGRTAPGTCRRLWSLAEHRARAAHDTPEIRRLDLAEPLLQLKSLGVTNAADFPWLEPPEPHALLRAENLLNQLGATDTDGRITALGKRISAFPTHPRLGRLLIEAEQRGCLQRATLWAALIGDRNIVTGKVPRDLMYVAENETASDLTVLERVFEKASADQFRPSTCASLGVDPLAAREVAQTQRLLERAAHTPATVTTSPAASETAAIIKSLLVGFPDHVAVLRDAHSRRCAMSGQKRVMLEKESVVNRPGPILALEVREIGRGNESQVTLSLVSQLEIAWLEELFPHRLSKRTVAQWNPETRSVEEVEEYRFDDLVLSSITRPRANPDAAGEILVDLILRKEFKLDQWDDKVDDWIARTRCVAAWFPERKLIVYDESDLRVILLEFVADASQHAQLRDRPLLPKLRDALSWDDQRLVETMAPSELSLPSGRKMKLEYQPGQPPRGRAKIQDLYGLATTPRIAGGRVPVVLEILGPNYRPLQVTEDLAGFWTNLYPTLRKELSRRYPRHEWR
ncbi:MAG: ATP-dependent helicase HrpB [Phycisphaeraceae bacterium]|nr:ATP-dependent helicase HrpB [Phycisphaeraceae bacterium]